MECSLRPATALKGASATLPAVDTVVVTIFPAVLTGTVTNEQLQMRHEARIK